MMSELNINNSLKILSSICEMNKLKKPINHIDFSNSEEFCDDFNYIEGENTLVIKYEFRDKLLLEIYEFIERYHFDSACIDDCSIFESAVELTILGGFSIFTSKKETILWNLLTILMLIDGNSTVIWEKKTHLLQSVLSINSHTNYSNFIEYEINLTRIVLSNVYKSSNIWNYLEMITFEYFRTFDGNDSSRTKLNEDSVVKFHDEFIRRQLNIYDNNYYCWSFVNWLIFTMVPSIKELREGKKFEYEEHGISTLEDWIIKLILMQPFNFGGYNALTNIIDYKIKNAKGNNGIDDLIKIAHSEKITSLLEKIVETFRGNPKDCILMVLHFRYCVFVIILDYTRGESCDVLLENEISSIKEMNLNEMNKEKSIAEIKEHLNSVVIEAVQYCVNIDNYVEIINNMFKQ